MFDFLVKWVTGTLLGNRMNLREKLAELAHDQWSGWMRYLFSTGEFNDDGTWIMPSWAVSRWVKQMETPYIKLIKGEQESDRKEADKFLGIIEKMRPKST